MSYQGWKNYETWAVGLWIDNEQSTQEMMSEWARKASLGKNPRAVLADQIKELVEENAPDLGATLYSDLLTAAISEVDWFELAKNYLDEVVED